MKKTIKQILLLFFTLFLVSCTKTPNTPKNYSLVKDEVIINEVINYNFNYEVYTPGNQLSYGFIWDGYDLNNYFGPKYSKEDRLHTYLNEYKKTNNEYYLVYLDSSIVKSYTSFVKKYEDDNKNNPNFNLTEINDAIVDGKFLREYQQHKDKKILIYNTNNIDNIVEFIDNYELIFVCETKDLIIKENLSTSTILNKNVKLLNRVLIKFENNIPIRQIVDDINNNINNFVGELVEVYPSNFTSLSYSTIPMIGFKNDTYYSQHKLEIINTNDIKYVKLLRYTNYNGNKVDLLNNSRVPLLVTDVYKGYNEEFKKALYKDLDDLYALYDFNKVKDIIKTK